MGSFLCHFTILGSQYSAGIFVRALTQELGIDQGLASWVTSIAVAMMLGGGLVTGTLVDVFGPRIVGLLGTVLTALGMLLTSFSTTLWQAAICYGVISGAGFSCGLVASTVVLTPYFTKRTATAIGLAVAGSGVGTLALSSAATALVLEGGYQLAFRVMAIFAVAAMGLATSTYVPAEAVQWLDGTADQVPALPCCARAPTTSHLAPAALGEDVEDNKINTDAAKQAALRSGTASPPVDAPTALEVSAVALPVRSASRVPLSEPPSDRHFWCPSRAACSINNDCKRIRLERFGWSCCASRPARDSVAGKDSEREETDAPTVVKLWKTREFVQFALSVAVAAFGYFVPFAHLVAFLEDERGFTPSEAGWFMSTIGVTSLAGRIFLSRLADIHWMPPLVLLVASMLLMGIPTLLLPITTGVGWLYLYAVIFGIASGTFVAIIPVATVTIVGPRAMSLGFGQVFAAEGLPALLGPPITGWMRDGSGTFTDSWIVTGAVLTAAPLVLLCTVCRTRSTGPVKLGRSAPTVASSTA
jgi:MFS family permease